MTAIASAHRLARLALVGSALATALVTTAVEAQDPDPRLAARLDAATRGEVERLADSARAAGLPDEPLIQKALEGASKRAPGPRIVTAVARVLESLRGARDVLGREATADELVAGAASLRAGASSTMLKELQQLGPRDGLAVPLAVLTDLVVSGVAVDAAWRSVERLAQRGARDTEFLELRDRIDREAVDHPRSQGGVNPSLRFTAEGALGRTEPFGEGVTGTIAAAVFPAMLPTSFGKLWPEIAGRVSAGAHNRAYGSHSWDVAGRLHAVSADDRRGAWAGLGFGYGAAHESAETARRIDIGGWTRVGRTTVRVWFAQTAIEDTLRTSGPGAVSTPATDGTDSLSALGPLTSGGGRGPGTTSSTLFLSRFTDLGTHLAFSLRDRYEVEASLARRFGGEYRTTAWRVGGTMWLGGNVALVAAAGYAAPDLPAALPGGRFTTLSLRLALGAAHGGAPVPLAAGRATSSAATPAMGVEVRAGGRLIIIAPSAQAVEAMGDFTDWKPEPLLQVAEGRWEYPKPVAAGVHQFNVRLDGGAWVVPTGASAVDDGFGGRTGLLVVRP